MKIREAFVANSSSSSFIAAIAIIDDPTLFKKWITSYNYGDNFNIETKWYKDLEIEDPKGNKLHIQENNVLISDWILDIEVLHRIWDGQEENDNFDDLFDNDDKRFYEELSDPKISGLKHVNKSFGVARI